MSTLNLLKVLQDELGLTDDAARQMLARMVPSLVVGDLTEEPYRDPPWRLAFGGYEVVAVAGQYSVLYLFNPAGSGILVQVDRIGCRTNTGGLFELWEWTGVAATANLTQKAYLDQRIPSTPTAQLRFGNAVGHFGDLQVADSSCGIADPTYIYGPFILMPGEGIGLESVAVNTALTGTFAWRERVLRPEDG